MSAAAISSKKAAPRAKVAPKAKAAGASKPAPAHPTYTVMVADAIEQLKERSGSSKTAIVKYITQHYNLGDNVTMINVHIKRAITRGLAKALAIPHAISVATRFGITSIVHNSSCAHSECAQESAFYQSTKIASRLKSREVWPRPKGELQQVTEMGATGSFKLAPGSKQKKPVSPIEKKPIAKKTTDQPKAPKKLATKPTAEKKVKSVEAAAKKAVSH